MGGGVLFEAGNASQLAHLLVECDFQSMKRDPTPIQLHGESSFLDP